MAKPSEWRGYSQWLMKEHQRRCCLGMIMPTNVSPRQTINQQSIGVKGRNHKKVMTQFNTLRQETRSVFCSLCHICLSTLLSDINLTQSETSPECMMILDSNKCQVGHKKMLNP